MPFFRSSSLACDIPWLSGVADFHSKSAAVTRPARASSKTVETTVVRRIFNLWEALKFEKCCMWRTLAIGEGTTGSVRSHYAKERSAFRHQVIGFENGSRTSRSGRSLVGVADIG